MPFEISPQASLRVWAVRAPVGPGTIHVPPRPAADWLEPMMRGDLLDVLDLADEDPTDELLWDGVITHRDVYRAAQDLVAAASGTTCYAAMRIVQTAGSAWQWAGPEVLRTGIRLDEAPLGAAITVFLSAILKCISDKDRDGFIKSLNEPAENLRELAGPAPATDGRSVRERPKTRPRIRPAPPGDQTVSPIPLPEEPAPSDAVPPVESPPASGEMSPRRPSAPRRRGRPGGGSGESTA